MTRAEFTTRFPHASEACIRANCSDAVTRAPGPAPAGRPAALQAIMEPSRPPAPTRPPKPAKPAGKARVPRTRNAGRWTEAQFWGALRSGLRRTFRFWRPATTALAAAKAPCAGPRGQRFAYVCASCGKLHPRKRVQIDHVVPVGPLTHLHEIPEWLARLTAEDPKAFQVLCKQCHEEKTAAERGQRSQEKTS
jgi:hypothetical protein